MNPLLRGSSKFKLLLSIHRPNNAIKLLLKNSSNYSMRNKLAVLTISLDISGRVDVIYFLYPLVNVVIAYVLQFFSYADCCV